MPQGRSDKERPEARLLGDVELCSTGAMHKINLIEYLQDKICSYSNQEKTPSEQIKGMNRLLRDIILIDDERFEER